MFEKFFSLQRPDTGGKGTGIGLNFVKEVAVLRHGDVELKIEIRGDAGDPPLDSFANGLFQGLSHYLR